MLNVCEQSKLLHIPYFEKLLPANLYQETKINKSPSPVIEGYEKKFFKKLK